MNASTIVTAIAALEYYRARSVYWKERYEEWASTKPLEGDVLDDCKAVEEQLAVIDAAIADLEALQADSAAVGVDMPNHDTIYESVDKVSFDVLHEGRIRRVISGSDAEALMIDIADSAAAPQPVASLRLTGQMRHRGRTVDA